MQDVLGESLQRLKRGRRMRMRMLALLLVLSLLVSFDVFWTLRQPGLTLAGDADCHITEHTHDANCPTPCPLPEHVHTIHCYSDQTADVELPLEWQTMFEDYPLTGDLRNDLTGIAQTQVGYAESTLNFEAAADGTRHGYTRYGAWYGTPYTDWSALFVSFCLNYAGADPNVYPGNLGALAMAEQWKRQGHYAPVGNYTPVSGDLVFFNDNTVGIITQMLNANLYVIRGDMEGAVRGGMVSLTDPSIIGWGITGVPPPREKPPDKPQLTITVGETEPVMRAQTFSLRMTRAATDLVAYLQANGGSYFFTLLDKNNRELETDANGNYVVIADTGYKLTISYTAPKGFLPGTYQYQVPDGLVVDGGEGSFILKDGTNVGDWTVSDDGLITLVFNEHINSRTDITISATLGTHFPEQNDPIDFDGKISVVVQKPPEEAQTTQLTKWGIQGDATISGKTDPNRIYWNVSITGRADSQIPGSVLSDKVLHADWLGDHHYTEQDMAEGLRMGASDPQYNWHGWTVYPGDPNLTWTENGWSYTIPETIRCWCGEVTLGNEGWIYYLDYSSTPYTAGVSGTQYYMNRVTVDNQYYDGTASFVHGDILGEVYKTGAFVADASGGGFLWEVQAIIPARKEGERAEYHWYLMDYMYLINNEGNNAGPVHNDANLVDVTATYNGVTISVPNIKDATPNDPFAWDNAWTATNNGVEYGREINLLCRCQCTAESCRWESGCQEYWYEKEPGIYDTNGYCQCWTPTDNVTFTLTYKTTDLSAVEGYGGQGYRLQNVAELYYKPNGGSQGTLVSNTHVGVGIPGVFKKELTHDFDGYIANYKITLNEAKLVLTDGSPLTIHDEMTTTLAYISGSLVITAEDALGNVTTLYQDVDYTVEYDGTGNHTDDKGNEVHVLDVVILHPQPVTYTLDYDATLIMPEQVTGGIKYSNAATVTLWGEDVTDTSVEKVYADINIAAKSYKVEIFKTSALTGEPLGGALFGLYNAHGGLITTDVTDANGALLFQTNIVEGIVLREHELYYMQELRAPPGYQLDSTPYWFCFCDETGNSCNVCQALLAGIDNAVRIPFEQIGKIPIENRLMDYDLPATGGAGCVPLVSASITMIVIPLIYAFIRRRKRERRGVG